MTTALAESRVQMDTCCWALWSSATDRKAPKTGHARSEVRSGRDGRSHCLWCAEVKQSNPLFHTPQCPKPPGKVEAHF